MHLRFHYSFLMAVLLSATVPAQAETFIEGNNAVSSELIKGLLPAGGESTAREWEDKATKAVFGSGLFEDVSVSRKGSRVTVAVEEKPLLSRVVFEGNKRLGDEALLGISGLIPGEPVTKDDVVDAIAAINEAYMATGRHDTRVTASESADPGGRVVLTLTVEEGERIPVSKIWFKGNGNFRDNILKAVITTKQTNLYNRLLGRDTYTLDKVESDREALENFYRSEGFADARVLLSDVGRDAEGFTIGFVLDEGQRYTVGKTEIDASGKPVESDVAATLEGHTFTPQAIAKTAALLEKEAEKAGYMAPVVVPRVSKQPGHVASIRFTVDEGPAVYIERIEIEGNDRTRDYVIRREFDLAEGDLLRKSEITKAKRRLERLGFFDNVEVTTSRTSADRAILIVSVKERRTGQFSFGGGYSTKDGPIAEIGISQENMFGSGYGLKAFAGRGDDTTTFGVSFRNPYLFGNRITSETSVFRKSRETENAGRFAYDETETGGRFMFSAPLNENLSARFGYGLSVKSVRNVEEDFSSFVPAGDHVVSSVTYGLTFDTLDSRLSPSDGYLASVTQQIAGLGGDARYIKTEASFDTYRTLDQDSNLVLRLGGQAGHITGLGKRLDFIDHFQADESIVRGFKRNGFGPYEARSGFHLGGSVYAAAKAELSVPTPFFPESYGLRNIAFADLGNVWNPDSETVSETGADAVGSGKLRASVGTGIQWDSPIGRLRANFAFPILKEDGDKEQIFSFSGGTTF